MAKILEMPKLSPTMEEGQLAVWHKKVGDAVAVDDVLAEVETDKATMEFRSFDAGTLLAVLVDAGAVVRLGQAVAILGSAGEDISTLEAKARASFGAAAATPPLAAPTPPALAPAAAASASTSAPSPPAATSPTPSVPTRTDGRVRASPYVRKLAREQAIDLTGLRGTGPHGRIVARDLVARPPTPAGAAAPLGERRPASMMRKTIARRLTLSKQTVPHFYLTVDIDAGPLVALREQVTADLAASARDGEAPVKVSINDLLVRAIALALVEVPECNASWDEDAIVLHGAPHVSVAVAVEDGLLTPVVRDAHTKSVVELAREIRELAGRARAKRLRPEEMTGGTFSISNLGMFEIDSFSAVINPPEGAILAVGQVRDEPVVKNGAVVPGKRVALTLSCDHRVVDGAVGAEFLRALRRLLAHPTLLLL